MRKPTLSDVARAAGVSQGTVSNVYNRPNVVRPALREAVLAAARQLGYGGPAPSGRALRRGRANLIAVVSDESTAYVLADPYGRRLLGGVAAVCDAQGMGLTVASTHGTGSARDGEGWSIDTALADGFILYCYEDDAAVAAQARARGLPMVTVDAGGMAGQGSVGIDERAAARAAAEHLLDLGHRRFGVLSLELAADMRPGPVDAARLSTARFSGTRRRIDGYRDALLAAGLDSDALAIFETLNDRETAEAGLSWLFGRAEPPTALLTLSDVLALHACDWLTARGLSVPADVSVVGFDDTPEAAQATPPLTTVSQPAELKGRIAAEMLLGLRPMGNHLLATALTVRSSTAPPPNWVRQTG